MTTKMTVESAAEVYGLTTWNALSKRIKYAKRTGKLPQDTPHFKESEFSEATAVALELVPGEPVPTPQPQPQPQPGEEEEKPQPGEPQPNPQPNPQPVPRPKPRPASPNRWPKPKAEPQVEEPGVTKLQKQLSADWIIKWVLYSLILADGVAFAVIAERKIDNLEFVEHSFFYLGIMSGIGAIAMYCKIHKFSEAEAFKYIYGTLQFVVFEVALGTNLFSWETCITLMIIVVEMGVMRSIRK